MTEPQNALDLVERQRKVGALDDGDALYRVDEITAEVDRYLVIAGQALADEIGRREIFFLREVATGARGDRFVLPGFQDGVLGSSTIGLPVLGAVVSDWVVTRRAA